MLAACPWICYKEPMISKFLLSLIFLLPAHSFAKTAKAAKPVAKTTAKTEFSPVLVSVVDKYAASKLITMKVTKTVRSELLDKETKYLGNISLAGQKFRLDTNTPDKALILFDGSVLWNVQFPSKELGGNTQVLKSKLGKKNKSQILLSALLDKKSLKKNFKVLKEEKGKPHLISIAPVTKDLSVKEIDLSIDDAKKTLSKISYKDDVGNLTTMEFSDITFSSKPSKDLFKFQLPKDAQVTEL